MSLLAKLFGNKKKTQLSAKDTILRLFDESAAAGRLEGQTIVAVAAIYEHAPRSPSSGQPVEMPSKLHLAQMNIFNDRPGFIDAKSSLAPDVRINMRELHQGESTEKIFLNNALAVMLAEHLSPKELRGCKAISWNGDTPAFGMFWMAVLARMDDRLSARRSGKRKDKKPKRQLEKISPEEAQRRYTAGEDLINVDLSGADLRRLYLAGANLTGSNLSYANLYGMNLDKCVLRNADLRHANLASTFLQTADLTGADLTGAMLRGAHLP